MDSRLNDAILCLIVLYLVHNETYRRIHRVAGFNSPKYLQAPIRPYRAGPIEKITLPVSFSDVLQFSPRLLTGTRRFASVPHNRVPGNIIYLRTTFVQDHSRSTLHILPEVFVLFPRVLVHMSFLTDNAEIFEAGNDMDLGQEDNDKRPASAACDELLPRVAF